jgi:hypothetical protein
MAAEQRLAELGTKYAALPPPPISPALAVRLKPNNGKDL